jgi:hypothetical protein
MQWHLLVRGGLVGSLLLGGWLLPAAGTWGSDSTEKITFDDHIQPIFRQKCASCHNPDKKSSGLDLTSYTAMMEGGSSGDAVDPGSPDGSYLYLLVTHDSQPYMPPESDRLPDESLDLIGRWIEQGALENAGSKPLAQKKPRMSLELTESPTERPAKTPLPGRLEKDPLVSSPVPGAITAMATSPWAPVTAVSGQRQVLLYHTESHELLGILPFPEGIPYSLRFSRNGALLLAGGGHPGASGRVVVWNVATGERVFEVGDELDAVLAADINADQTLIALGGPQKVVRVYATDDGSLQYELRKHTDWIYSLEFSPDGVLLASGDRAGNLHVWEGYTGREYLTLKGHTDAVTSLSWRSDSNLLASASEDGSVRVWGLENGNQVKNWNAHGGGVTSLEFTRDGRLVTSGRDRVSKLWGTDWNQQQQFGGFSDITLQVTFCDETERVAVADWTGAIRLFQVGEEAPVGELQANPPSLATRLETAEVHLAEVQERIGPLEVALTTARKAEETAKASAEESTAALEQTMNKQEERKSQLAGIVKEIGSWNEQREVVRLQIEELEASNPKLEQAAALLAQAASALDKAARREELSTMTQALRELNTRQTEELSDRRKKQESLDKQLETGRGQQEQVEVALKEAGDQLPQMAKQAEEAQARLKAAQEQLAAATEAITPVREELQLAEAAVTRWRAELDFVSEVKKLEEEREAAEQQAAAMELRRLEVAEQLGTLTASLKEASDLEARLGDAEQQAEKELSDAKTAVQQAEALLAERVEAAKEAEQQAEMLKGATTTLAMAVEKALAAAKEAEDEELQAAAQRLEQVLKAKQDELSQREQRVVESIGQREEAESRKKKLGEQLQVALKQFESARQQHAEAVAKRDQLAAEKVELESGLAEAEATLARLEEAAEAVHDQLLALRQAD